MEQNATRISDQHVVTLTYELREGGPEGPLMERMNANYPFIFLFGAGKLLPKFEEYLEGLGPDDQFEFILSPEEAYGPHHEGNIIRLLLDQFMINGDIPPDTLVKGNNVQLTADNGETFSGTILRWDDTHVWVDFNHAMAGKTLHFKGAILNIRKATLDELVRKHYIEDDGVRGGE